ncbi:MAG: hypothetical protein GX657_15605 [Chloroflexi bacterium]|jgi:predicted NBD/HSP70 family sugar kinase|nr:hypothetical protein [Chloroflexota bacterium]
MTADWLDKLLASLTPESFGALVRRLAAAQAPGNRAGVSLPALIDALTGGADLGSGPLGWSRQLRLKQAISDLAARTPGLRYIEGDA